MWKDKSQVRLPILHAGIAAMTLTRLARDNVFSIVVRRLRVAPSMLLPPEQDHD